MAKKSILEIEVHDEQFKKFLELFERYQQHLKGSASLNRAAGEAMDETAEKAGETLRAAHKSAQEYTDDIRKSVEGWREMGYVIGASVLSAQQAFSATSKSLDNQTKKTKEFSKAWKEAGATVVAFGAALGLAFGAAEVVSGVKNSVLGLLGRGGLPFGIDRLAYGAGASYRSATGLGVSIGEQKAFGVQFGRLVDANKLNDVQGARYDLSRRGAFAAMGISNPDQGGVADLTMRLLRRAQQLYQPGMSDQQLNALGVGQFFNREELNRLKSANLSQIEGQYRGDVGRLGYGNDTARAWQEFGIKLQESSGIIEKTLINSLGKLVENGTLNKLSDSLVKLVEAIGESPKVQHWLDESAKALERLASWLGGKSAGAGTSSSESAGSSPIMRMHDRLFGDDYNSHFVKGAHHNPGNIMIPGTHQLATYSSDASGLGAIAFLLRRYQHRFHLDTIEGLLSKYAPRTENDTEAYIRGVAKSTGFGRNSHLDLSNDEVLAKLISAITKHEDHRSNFTPTQVKAVIENRTGSNVVVNATQAAAAVTGNQ